MFKNKLVVGLLAAGLIVLAILAYGSIYQQQSATNQTGSQQLQLTAAETEKTKVQQVVLQFSQNMKKVAPPNVDEQAVNEAKGLLTTKKQAELEKAPSLSAGLARFAGVQDVPDEEIRVSEVEIQENFAEAKVQWNYSGQMVIKTFTLFKQVGEWKIDQIR